MEVTFQFESVEEKQQIIINNTDKYLIEERQLFTGNFLVFSTIKPLVVELEDLKKDSILLKAQNQAIAERTDFHEDLIAEMAMMIYE